MFSIPFLLFKPNVKLSILVLQKNLAKLNLQYIASDRYYGSTNTQVKESLELKSKIDPDSSVSNEEFDADSHLKTEFASTSTTDDVQQFELSLTEEQRKKFKKIQYEYELWKFADSTIPDVVENKDWIELLAMKSSRERLFYLTKLYRKSKSKIKIKEQLKTVVAERKEQREKTLQENPGHLIYQLGQNCLFNRIPLQKFHKSYTFQLLYSFFNGPHIVYDMSYMKLLAKKEQILTYMQILRTISANRGHKTPANLILSDVDEKEEWFKIWQDRLTPSFLDDYPVIMTNKRYCDLFPKERIVYLSPDAERCLTSIDTDKVYIVGGCVDKMTMKPRASLEKARNDGVECLKLPLDYYLKWEMGHKYLCLDHVLLILLDMSMTNDWYTVLQKRIPNRKFTPATEIEIKQSRLRNQRARERAEFLISITDEHN